MLGYWEGGVGGCGGLRGGQGSIGVLGRVGGGEAVQGGMREGGFWQKSWHHSTTLSTAGLLSRRVMMM